MNEFVMVLWAMTAGHPQWPMPPKEPVAIVQPSEQAPRGLTSAEREQLRRALHRFVRESKGTALPKFTAPK
ncbi:MAG: hypothetical protein C5B51_19120 [Terriglobia bacterium]|nr:MAG: hypothetical protein C5B51_19120 [Terriglobia bacterium]